jgi:hypothetical protein
MPAFTRVSAVRDDTNQWQIDPAELFIPGTTPPPLPAEHDEMINELVKLLREQLEDMRAQVASAPLAARQNMDVGAKSVKPGNARAESTPRRPVPRRLMVSGSIVPGSAAPAGCCALAFSVEAPRMPSPADKAAP